MDFIPTPSVKKDNRSKKHKSIRKTMCCCCLAENRTVVNLQTCSHRVFVQDVLQVSYLNVFIACSKFIKRQVELLYYYKKSNFCCYSYFELNWQLNAYKIMSVNCLVVKGSATQNSFLVSQNIFI